MSKIIRTVIVTSMVTALAVSAVAFYVAPRISWNSDPYGATLQPASYSTPAADTSVVPPRYARVRRVASYSEPVYREPVYRQPVRTHRSTGKSVAIVAGSAGAGAAIGALAGGGKGAAIGGLAGGAAGFIYDRLTANKIHQNY